MDTEGIVPVVDKTLKLEGPRLTYGRHCLGVDFNSHNNY